ncbi:bifunctional diaminohydroxyphosphoribosylaminopyrimidine deaminase/5-amino-6-(5-phosphoribosylamino)uracil reductase RibD [Mangrovicoccus algicola]|uniref:Bifunctional diaminohydroxyphosphoribosylaminopyrimidine deaminase/5-amino-6-(5-phosphoribosylamino)uracil reductase RibD n=1 Tax=Mangrovicoccus algicola TaxID=2771008 RepID=A0A8J6ZEH7_9RHOB|nr:bifunctional diaminohydroxyphosphoribosylaminopyrimidine deaminase/5-amino-6-(5-phosphoribosylamino)uracil reductase RibD [Mangrovicoccus algicola]MBE3640256.1 bifunctional diaminohydroxyphosphoribosylaminopyrimidine deaminase/5-amino-6-(5-phosphoribosylamino)uracil reductase RibD [Mangrovicoccus algicola]
MQRALALARGVRGQVWPNPPVGCVVVRDGLVLAEAATHPGGRPHAERAALEQAVDAAGATLYVTLEPCCHWGRTPPCTDAIIAAGIRRVVCAIRDPDPRVNGGGFARLQDAGIELSAGLCAREAAQVMSGFFHRVRTGRPELSLLDAPARSAPEGVDALLKTVDGRLAVRPAGRPAQTLPGGGTPDAAGLLTELGGMGLTSIAVPAGDPVAAILRPFAGAGAAGQGAVPEPGRTRSSPTG